MIHRLAVLLFAATLAACGTNPPAGDPPAALPPAGLSAAPLAADAPAGPSAAPTGLEVPPIDSVDYAVYAEVLRHYALRDEAFFVVLDSTRALPRDPVAWSFLLGALRGDEPDAESLLDQLGRISGRRYALAPSFPLGEKTALTSYAVLQALFRMPAEEVWDRPPRAGWDAFGARFPGSDGYYEFSRIAFDRERQTALLMVHQKCGTYCERASYVVLRRSHARWKVTTDLGVVSDGGSNDPIAGPDTVHVSIPQQ